MNNIVFQEYFDKSNGKPFKYNNQMIKISEKIPLDKDQVSLKITFISNNSTWRQGIAVRTNGTFEFADDKEIIHNGIVMWQDTAPKQIELKIESKSKNLIIYNVWDSGDGTLQYGHNGGALFTEEVGKSIIFHCNDGMPDDDFDDLIFKVEFLT